MRILKKRRRKRKITLFFVLMVVFLIVFVASMEIEVPQGEKRITLSNTIFKKLLNSSQEMGDE